jgi:site-specific DNA-methyltransferase (adenine-specific)
MELNQGRVIRRLRERMGLTRAALARRVGVEASLLKWWEDTGKQTDPDLLATLAQALGTTTTELALVAGELTPELQACAQQDLRRLPGLIRDRLLGRTGDEPTPAEGATAEPPALPDPVLTTELGRLYQGDCLAVLPGLASRSVDCVFADPPFNLGKDYGQAVDDALEETAYLRWCLQWLDELVRVLKPGGALFLYDLPRWNIHLAAHLDRYLAFRHWVSVDIKFSLPITGRLYPSHYSLLYFVKGPRPRVFNPPRLPLPTCRHCGGEIKDYGGYKDRMNPRGVNLTDVWTDIPPVRHRRYKTRAANELALKMLDRVLDIATEEGDLVLDPLGGSGTTYAACELRGRRWIGVEIADCGPIVGRLSNLEAEREHLARIRGQINVLFTPEALALRDAHGHDTSRYRLPGAPEGPKGSPAEEAAVVDQLGLFDPKAEDP